MRKINKQPNVNNSSIGEVRPELFNFIANKGKSISLILKNENVKIGILLGICEDGTVLLDMASPIGTGLSETLLFDVSEILVMNN